MASNKRYDVKSKELRNAGRSAEESADVFNKSHLNNDHASQRLRFKAGEDPKLGQASLAGPPKTLDPSKLKGIETWLDDTQVQEDNGKTGEGHPSQQTPFHRQKHGGLSRPFKRLTDYFARDSEKRSERDESPKKPSKSSQASKESERGRAAKGNGGIPWMPRSCKKTRPYGAAVWQEPK